MNGAIGRIEHDRARPRAALGLPAGPRGFERATARRIASGRPRTARGRTGRVRAGRAGSAGSAWLPALRPGHGGRPARTNLVPARHQVPDLAAIERAAIEVAAIERAASSPSPPGPPGL